ncbi:MAG: hypothetical protein HEQ37_02740 [Acidovorax sp.]|jgi:hypothetical protein|uniref:hypothetical protein n=1 Tax=Acidovorax sp. TaxID=1872122 RepID=UPI0025BAE906|nr:hypothetical protein [Acidovorax sp.]MCO4093431.1 hypothetical protein [Acidovorax sp.]MDH4425951.1 hypothetical protein [Acidovorax sp.]MDH4447176.1 hypothetical protein [Acidovorax sp.]
MKNKVSLARVPVALACAAVLGLAGCGGGGSDSAVSPETGPVMVDAFNYVAPIVGTGMADMTEPQDISRIVLSTTETEEPDTRL